MTRRVQTAMLAILTTGAMAQGAHAAPPPDIPVPTTVNPMHIEWWWRQGTPRHARRQAPELLPRRHVQALGALLRHGLVDLAIEQTKPPMLLLGDGRTTTYCHSAWIYARTRQRVTGTIKKNGKAVPVTGTSAFDHTWGFTPVQDLAGWDWLNFELDDGRDIDLFTVSLRKGGDEFVAKAGSISAADGRGWLDMGHYRVA